VVRSSRGGRVSGGGFLDDHANAAHGLVELHVATGDVRWLLEARRIADRASGLLAEDDGGEVVLACHHRVAPRARSVRRTRAAGSSSRPTTARPSPPARRTSTTIRSRPGTR